MVEWLENPRKAPRVRLRLPVSVLAGAVAFEAATEDLGPHGCQLLAPRALPAGAALTITLRAAEAPAPLHASAGVAWVSPRAPWRIGVAFDPAARPAAATFFGALVAVRPGLSDWQRVPDRISYDAMVWLAPPPRLVVDFMPDEVAVLRAIGSGATVFELRSRLRTRWAEGQRALFSLLAGRYVTLARGGAVPFANWSTLLHQLEAELAVGSMDEAPAPRPAEAAPPPRPAPRAASGQAAPASGRHVASHHASPARPVAGNDGAAGLDVDLEALELDQAPPAAARPGRPREAEEAFGQALQELAAGRQVSALALLRAALALAPGDLEIARKLGEVASGRG